jgi:hypothetical protein
VRNFGALRSEVLIALLYQQLLAVVQFLVDTKKERERRDFRNKHIISNTHGVLDFFAAAISDDEVFNAIVYVQ